MASYTVGELARAFRRVRGNTIRIAEEIPEEHYSFRATPATRSIGELLVHIAAGPMGQLQIHGNGHRSAAVVDVGWLMDQFAALETVPRTKAEIITYLREEGERFASFLDGLSEEFLDERVENPGDPTPFKSRLEMLMGVKEHEMHHRGQLMLMQRMIGLVPHLTRSVEDHIRSNARKR